MTGLPGLNGQQGNLGAPGDNGVKGKRGEQVSNNYLSGRFDTFV